MWVDKQVTGIRVSAARRLDREYADMKVGLLWRLLMDLNYEDKLLTFNEISQLMPDPMTSWRAWPASERQMPVWGHRGQHGERSTLGASGLARALTKVIISVIHLKVTHIDHQVGPHQHCLHHLQWQITQHLQQQHQLVFFSLFSRNFNLILWF